MEENFKICCFTGYRPSKFPFPLNKSNREYVEFENELTMSLLALFDDECYTFYTGGAMGFDIIAAEAVLDLKKVCRHPVKLICALPFKEQSNTYTDAWRARYNAVLDAADEIVYTSEEYHRGCYSVRNRYMVDNSDYILTWYDGAEGGTKNTINYARKVGKTVVNLCKKRRNFQEDFCDVIF